MGDNNVRHPKSTPRRTLGMSRIKTPKTVPLTSTSPKYVHNASNATPAGRKRVQIDQTSPKIPKKLRLTESPTTDNIANTKEYSIDELKNEIIDLENTLGAAKKHQKKKEELENLISRWKNGGLNALTELQMKSEPKKSIQFILNCLNITTELFDLTLLDD